MSRSTAEPDTGRVLSDERWSGRVRGPASKESYTEWQRLTSRDNAAAFPFEGATR